MAKVTPIVVSPPKHKNKIIKTSDLISQFRVVIVTSALIGVNRLYLLKNNKLLTWCTYMLNISIGTFVLYILTGDKLGYGYHSYNVFIKTICAEFIILVINSIFFQRKNLVRFFDKIDAFDKMLNIKKDIVLLCSLNRAYYWILVSLTYSAIECISLSTYLMGRFNKNILSSSFGMLVHDTEQIFICLLLRTIFVRVSILKGHIIKTFDVDAKMFDTEEELNEFERLAKNAQLDVTALHKAYELLHEVADELNSFMSFPMIVMLMSSGLSSIVLLKNLFISVQYNGMELKVVLILYISFRCLKYTILVIIPCYYSSLTTKQVQELRTILHNAVNTFGIDKIERRKLKALFQLTRDNEFAYALWGVINLNMTLPLSYISLFITYLVIVIQFSKFID